MMNNHMQGHNNDGNDGAVGFLAGVLIGGLAGAGAMLLLAPQSGKRTRANIQRQSQELRDQATVAIEDAMDQARDQARKITADVQNRAEALQQRGQEMFDGQKERLFTAVETGKKAVQVHRG